MVEFTRTPIHDEVCHSTDLSITNSYLLQLGEEKKSHITLIHFACHPETVPESHTLANRISHSLMRKPRLREINWLGYVHLGAELRLKLAALTLKLLAFLPHAFASYHRCSP